MANAIYPKWKETVMQGGANSSLTGTVKVALVEYSPLDGDIDVAGDWTMWAYITFTNTKVSIGEPATFKIYEEGE